MRHFFNAYAKLNLGLHILPKCLPSGYYEVRFMNCELELYDKLFFEERKQKIEIIGDNLQVPLAENLIYKAAALFKKIVNREDLGTKIILKKNIAVKAGLGGGSADAVATIKGLMKLWKLDLDKEQLRYLASKLGKDVYYCLQGGVCEVKGDGRDIIPLNVRLPKLWLVIITPEIEKPSTAWMYQHLNPSKIGQNIYKFDKLKTALIAKDKKEIINNLHNDFEKLAIPRFPVVEKIKKDLETAGADNALLAGSGLSVVGVFTEEKNRDLAYQQLKNFHKYIICTETK